MTDLYAFLLGTGTGSAFTVVGFAIAAVRRLERGRQETRQ